MSNDPELMAGFLDEAGQYVAVLNERLLQAESLSEVPRDMLDEMFRAAHSMKGTAGFLDLDDVCAVTHKLETVLDHVRKGHFGFSTPVVEALFNAFDTVSALLVDIANNSIGGVSIESVLSQLDTVLGSEPAVPPPAATDKPDEELCSSGDDKGIEHLGPLPAWLVGRLDELDVCEAIVALAAGQRVYVLRFAGDGLFASDDHPLAVYACLAKHSEVRCSIPLFEGSDNPWRPFHEYRSDIGFLIFCPGRFGDVFGKEHLPLGTLWELGPEVNDHSARSIGEPQRVDLGRAQRSLIINPEMIQHRGTWLSNSWEELGRLDTELMAFEQNPRDMQHIDELFRLMHSLKGSSATMGLNEMARVAHNAETLLDAYRHGKSQADNDGFRALFSSADFLSGCLEAIDKGSEEGPDAADVDAIMEHCFTHFRPSLQLAEWAPDAADREYAAELIRPGQTAWAVTLMLQAGTPLPDIRYGMIIEALGHEGQVAVSHPSMEEIEDGCEDPGVLNLILLSEQSHEDLNEALAYDMVARHRIEALDISPQHAEKGDGTTPNKAKNLASGTASDRGVAAQANTVRVDTARLDQMMNAAGELVITKARVSQEIENLNRVMSGINTRDLDAALDALRGLAGERQSDLLPRAMADLAGLKQAQEQSLALRDTILELHRHTSQMQNSIMRARMVPIGPLFQRFHRLVRDLCKERERSARLVCAGEGTELDKKLIDELADPLTHLVRNAIDHGMEDPAERVAAGKPEQGTLHLEAFHEGGQIGIRLRDDGRGLDRAKIIAKAVSNGLISAEAGERMPDEDVNQLIFQPGFSTAAQVTNISGRGVGMDIVRSCIADLKGSITIETRPGAGTCFTIRLPLTLAMIDALMVRIGDTRYAAPLETVGEIVELEQSDVKTVEGRSRMIWLRDRHVSLVDPVETLGVERARSDSTTVRAVVTKDAGETVAILVDQVLGQEEIVVKALPADFQAVRGISGATVLGDGGIALILDIAGITALARRGGRRQVGQEAQI